LEAARSLTWMPCKPSGWYEHSGQAHTATIKTISHQINKSWELKSINNTNISQH